MRFWFILIAIPIMGLCGSASAGPFSWCHEYYQNLVQSFTNADQRSQVQLDAVVDNAFPSIFRSLDPYSTEFLLGKNSGEREQALLEFHDLARADLSTGKKAKQLNRWVNSPERALFTYQNLARLGEKAAPVFTYLLQENQYFKNARPIRGPPHSLVTQSFEKETRKKYFASFYKPRGMSDDAWLALPEAERVGKLHELGANYEKRRVPWLLIEPTALKPAGFGGYMEEEASTFGRLWEFAHKNYEFDPARLHEQMVEVSRALNETDFHLHTVFEIPTNYSPKNMAEFSAWVKHLNDYVYLRGLEEDGLHWTYLSKFPERPQTGWLSFLARQAPHRGPERASDSLPKRLSEIDDWRFKYLNAGVRAGIYGPSAPGFKKIGVELRDATRKMETWKDYTFALANSCQEKIWEGRDLTDPRHENEIFLTRVVTSKDVRALTDLGLTRKVAKHLLASEPTLMIALRDYEHAQFYDYHTGQYHQADAATLERINAARAKFKTDLLGLQTELGAMRLKREKVDDDDLKTAIRWSLTDWAKAAKISGLFRGI